MRTWAQKHLPPPPAALRILECGCGNGTLLLSFLTSKPATSSSDLPPPQTLHLTGIDYSPLSLVLAKEVEEARREAITEEIDEEEDEEVINEVETDWRAADLLRHDFKGEEWDLVMDKGTYDALCLSNEGVEEEGGRLPSKVYPEKVAKLVKGGGFFLITSCNFTEEEIKARWTVDGLGELASLL
jgi:SAM-dependent methyltransferase